MFLVETHSSDEYHHHHHVEASPHHVGKRKNLRQDRNGPLRLAIERNILMDKRPTGTPRLWSRGQAAGRRWSQIMLHQRGEKADPHPLHLQMQNYMDVMYTGTVKLGKSKSPNDMVRHIYHQ